MGAMLQSTLNGIIVNTIRKNKSSYISSKIKVIGSYKKMKIKKISKLSY